MANRLGVATIGVTTLAYIWNPVAVMVLMMTLGVMIYSHAGMPDTEIDAD